MTATHIGRKLVETSPFQLLAILYLSMLTKFEGE
jgi:hypothetical protein